MKFHIWQSLYILWVNQYYLKDLPHRKCKIIALKETPKGEGWNDYELVCEVLGDETRFKVNYDSFWFTHPKTRNTETDEEEDFKVTPSKQQDTKCLCWYTGILDQATIMYPSKRVNTVYLYRDIQ